MTTGDTVELNENYTSMRWDRRRKVFQSGMQFTLKGVDDAKKEAQCEEPGTLAVWPIPLRLLEVVKAKRR